jgi:hypothetical protein
MQMKKLVVATALSLAGGYAVAGDWQELPSNGSLIVGTNRPARDALYLEEGAISFLQANVPFMLPYTAKYNPSNPLSNPWPTAGMGILDLLDHRITRDIVMDGREIGDLYDFVFRDSRDSKLVFGMRTLLGTQADHQQDAELNFLYRYGFATETRAFSAAAAWTYTSDADLRMYNVGRTASNSLLGATPYDADTIRMQSDVNVSEGNPFSGLFLVKTDATEWRLDERALGVFQAGEEGQARVGSDFAGFVPWITGLTSDDPVMPTVNQDGSFLFTNLQSGLWYDPPMVDGFDISLSGGATFQKVTTPLGFDNLELVVGGVTVDSDLDGGESHTFAAGVTGFIIRGIDPDLDQADPGFGNAFPLQLSFNNPSGSTMTWDPIVSAPIPEPSTWAMLLGGLGLLTVAARRRA